VQGVATTVSSLNGLQILAVKAGVGVVGLAVAALAIRSSIMGAAKKAGEAGEFLVTNVIFFSGLALALKAVLEL